MPFTIELANAEYAPDIAKIFVSNESDPMLRLQLGSVDPSVLNEGLTERLKESIQRTGQQYIVARDEESGQVVSYASWTLPRGEMEPESEENLEVTQDSYHTTWLSTDCR